MSTSIDLAEAHRLGSANAPSVAQPAPEPEAVTAAVTLPMAPEAPPPASISLAASVTSVPVDDVIFSLDAWSPPSALPADISGCAPMTLESSALDLASLADLGRSVSPDIYCNGSSRFYGGYVMQGGRLYFERSRSGPYGVADAAAFTNAMAREHAQLLSDPRPLQGASGPMLTAEALVDGRRCLAWEAYGSRTRFANGVEGAMTVASGLLCDQPDDPYNAFAYAERVRGLRFTPGS